MRDVIAQTWGWDEEWQRRDFATRLSVCAVSVVDVNGQPAGSVWVEYRPGAIHLVELQILPAMQGKGIGTAVIRDLIQEAARHGSALTLSVVHANARAARLYERLGFRAYQHESPFIHMRYQPDPSAA